ncbi:MAG: hypothetical protein J07AB43_16220 [Candidatus Nanosalina sp. J07AB43]|nr:MAG: hypothetical protein J07AB43_16220 [Candidatus Nanosalina sp. J07AB43]
MYTENHLKYSSITEENLEELKRDLNPSETRLNKTSISTGS